MHKPLSLRHGLLRGTLSITVGLVFLYGVETLIAQSALQDGFLARYAQQAKAKGKTSITIPAGDPLRAGAEPLEQALNRTSVVIAKRIATATSHDKDHITTWTRYRIIETLSTQPSISPGPLPTDIIPASLLPLGPGEFLLADRGGTAVVNGVQITEKDPDRTALPENKRHLMFVMFQCSGMMAQLNYGAEGLFAVDDSDVISNSAMENNNRMRQGSAKSHRGAALATKDHCRKSAKFQ